MLPGLCWFFHISVCAFGISAQGNTSDMQGSSLRSTISLLAAAACLRCAKWLPCNRFWCIHMKRTSKVQLNPVVPAQITTIPPFFTTSEDTGNVASPGCSNTMSTLTPLPVMSQIALPKRRASFSQTLYSGELTLGS